MSAATVTGDIGGLDPRLLERLNRLAQRVGKPLHVTSGYRSVAEQRRLWEGAPANGLVRGISVAPPGGSLHQAHDAADVTVNGVAIYNAVSAADLQAVGLYPLGAADTVHVQLYPAGTSFNDARKQDFLAGHQDHGPLGIKKPGGPLADTAIGDELAKVGDAAGGVIGKGVDAAGNATANAIVDYFASWWGSEGNRVVLYVVLVGGGVALATVGTSRTLGLRREVTT